MTGDILNSCRLKQFYMKYFISFLLSVFIITLLHAQNVHILTSGTKTSLRGLSAVDDNIVWVSGSGGKVGKSTDGGAKWSWFTVPGFEKKEFRSIEAFDSSTAVIMAIDSPAVILKTTDGGITWKPVYRNDTKGMFLDAMDFTNETDGVVIGDPVNGRFFLAQTSDAGNSWKELNEKYLPAADSGEACFASSGSNVLRLKSGRILFVSGGLSSHFYNNAQRMILPILQGTESTGANSVASKNHSTFMVVGGDFNVKDAATKNCFITYDAGRTWSAPDTAPHGYRSCVIFVQGDTWITCGLNGVDISTDSGKNFKQISKEGFHTCRKAKAGSMVFFAGGNGKVGILF